MFTSEGNHSKLEFSKVTCTAKTFTDKTLHRLNKSPGISVVAKIFSAHIFWENEISEI